MPCKKKTPHARRISPGTRTFFLTIYLPWLLHMLPYSYWASICLATLPTYTAFMISVRQASELPPASFRFPVTRDTLALGYILPAVGRIGDFHPLKHAPAGRTMKKRGQTIKVYPLYLLSVCRISVALVTNQLLYRLSYTSNFHQLDYNSKRACLCQLLFFFFLTFFFMA